MAINLILHISDEEPILGEVAEMPKPSDTVLVLLNPRRVDGKDIHYLTHGVSMVMWPITRASFIEILPSEQEEEIYGFIRE